MIAATPNSGSQFLWEKSYPQGLSWSMPIAAKTGFAVLDEAVEAFPDRPFMAFMGKKYTYAAGGAWVNRFAAGLQSIGVRQGDKVGLCLPNCPYYIVAYYALLKIGAVVVNFNPLYADREMEHLIRDSGCTRVITLDLAMMHDKLMKFIGSTPLQQLIIGRMQDILPFPKNLLFPLLKRKDLAHWQADGTRLPWQAVMRAGGDMPTPVSINPAQDVAVLQYTGGTTGTPKGAMLSHQNIYANAVQCATWFDGAVQGQERLLAVIPFFHVFSMTAAMNMATTLAAEIIMLPRFEIKEVLSTIEREKPTLFPAVPTIFTGILNYKDTARYNLTSINKCVAGGAPLPVETKAKFEALTGCALVEGYGLSEASPVTHCNPVKGVNKAGSIGLPLPQTAVSLRALEDVTQEVPQGERGELCIKGPQVMLGYWNKPQDTAAVMLEGGWLRTGDVAVMDEDGYCAIVDRIKDMILCSGYNVYPRNVEEAIYQHPAVQEVIVLGVDDAYRGQTVKAYIKLKAGQTLTLESLNAFLQDKLSPIERPKLLELRDELPKTLIGKLSRKALKDEINGGSVMF